MSLPRTEIILQTGPQTPNPNDTACIPGVVGVCSAGPIGVVRNINRLADLAEFGYGPGVRLAAAHLDRAGGPVRMSRAPTGTASVLSTAEKYPVLVTATALYGSITLPGADANGRVQATARLPGYSVVVINPGADGSLTSSVNTATKVVTITLAYAMAAVTTTGTALAAYINANLSTYLSAVAIGTGASLASAMASTAITGDISYTPRQSGVRVRHTAVANQTLAVSVSTKDVTIALACDANAIPTSTAAAVIAKIAATSAALLLISAEASGDGTGKAGIWGYQSLAYGSGGSMSLAGTPVDRFCGRVEVTTAGTVGATPSPAVRWSLDRGEHWTAPQAVPANGVLSIQDTQILSGITATFSGALSVGDLWHFETTEPTATQSDVVSAVGTVVSDPNKPVGFVAVAQALSKAETSEVEGALQALWAQNFASLLVSVRDEGAAESHSAWIDAIAQDFLGYRSSRGLAAVCAGHAPHADAYTGRTYHAPIVFFAGPSRAACPVHVDLGQVVQGQATSNGATLVFGGPILRLGGREPGRSTIGGLVYAAKQAGVAVLHATQTGNSLPLTVGVTREVTSVGTRVILTVTLGTDNAGAIDSTQTAVAAAVNAVASRYVTATVTSGGTVVTATAYPVEIADRQVTHDEYLTQGLGGSNGRFVTMRSYPQNPGAIYFTGAPTFADPSETGYTDIELRDVIFSVARIADGRGYRWVKSTLASIPVAESESVPKGALDAQEAARVERDLADPIELFLFRPKLDGRPSASPYPPGERAAQVARDYDYQSSRELRISVGVYLYGLTEVVRIEVSPK